jgi:cytochrome c556
MTRNLFIATLAALASLSPALAQTPKPEDQIKLRKAAYSLMGYTFGSLDAMASGKRPMNKDEAARNAELLAQLATIPKGFFGEGTDKGETRAKPEVWSESEKFRAAASKMQEEVAKLNTAAKTGNLDTIKAAFGPVGQSCKACHDHFRKE